MPIQKTPKGAAAAAIDNVAVSDPRFSSFATDPRFRLPSKKHTRTKIDKRFSRMLKDEDFANTAKVDRYGRKLSSTSKKQALQRLYQPEEDDEEDAGVEVEDDEIVAKELRRASAGHDPARGGGFSASEDEDEEEDEEDSNAEVEEAASFPDIREEQAGVPMGEVSRRFACVNMDFDNIRAVDLMAVFSSFVPAGGRIVKISVYKSEFGKERMAREELEGPPKELFNNRVQEDEGVSSGPDSEDESEDEEELEQKIKEDLLKEDNGNEFDSSALRKYQLERLRYFYAVVVCSDEDTAQRVYEATDGREFLSSANYFDLRFVPDDTEFDDKPRDECDSIPSGYRPTEFVTDALQHSKVKLTWDAEDSSRKDVIKRAFSGSRADIGENDLKAYLGSDSSDDEDDVEADLGEGETTEAPKLTKKELARRKMRATLGLSDEPAASRIRKTGPVGDMEITFTSGLSTKQNGSVFQNEPTNQETTAEAYIRKEKERKARRKEKVKATREGRDLKVIDHAGDADEKREADLGFDDPFFAPDEGAKKKASKSQRAELKRKKREAKAAETEARASERAELELLMDDDGNNNDFDINEIARVEKAKKKKKSRSRKDGEDVGGKRGGLQENFEMDVTDPRFSAVFDSHEFAIDPSNPKYKGTEGMKKLLEEGRKKRRVDEHVDGKEEVVSGRVKRPRKDEARPVPNDELKSLVESVKRKVQR
ncbi:MAG: pre-rRNA-processing protein esf1 [Claussenomyces sp. TS43310]|nr:MAG: pre-rRNA-processing protein esf1 [Claussenomyces sp. TS43310]